MVCSWRHVVPPVPFCVFILKTDRANSFSSPSSKQHSTDKYEFGEETDGSDTPSFPDSFARSLFSLTDIFPTASRTGRRSSTSYVC